MAPVVCILFAFGALALVSQSGQALKLVPAGKLPVGRSVTGALYDNANSIYVIGGVSTVDNNDIYRYDIQTTETETVGHFEPYARVDGGSAHIDQQGNVFYFAGTTNENTPFDAISTIFKLSTTTSEQTSPVAVASLPTNLTGHCSVFDGSTGFYTIGGSGSFAVSPPQENIFHYDSDTNTVTVLTPSQPINSEGHQCVEYNNYAYMFGGGSTSDIEEYYISIRRLKLAAMEVETLNTDLHTTLFGTSAVLAGNKIYIIGGFAVEDGEDSNVVQRFDPITETIEVLEVEGFNRDLFFLNPVYVESLNRIYVFGGIDPRHYGYREDIFYLQLE